MANAAKYLELAEQLATYIREECEPGDRFPKVADLALQHGVAPNTASRAVQTLKEQGLLSGKPGGSTWVRVPPVQSVRRNTRYQTEKDLVLQPEEQRRSTGVAELDTGIRLASMHESDVHLDVVPAPADVAEALELTEGSLVLRRTSTRRHRRGAGVSKSVSYMPHDLASRNPDLFDKSKEPWPGGAQHQLHTVGVEVGRIEDHLTATMPTDTEIEEQDIPPAVPVIRVRKVTYSTTGQIVEIADIPLPADRVKLVYVTELEPWNG
ncbi:GntR family transcriptional regulator (plasmid) [Streptomyces sp. NBC_01754]|uniref:GntR family transcriptional regulator n=1 Tax=Streptomyces sp. NBC_01754 TaxID=2975930 RepID=UPI002DDB2DF5|nr:GntR family transcriptional regulator [Streptomyces sp. NBC_01754]WSC97074.1 GntR family transcriptional regulator [Streptomyces sp. NBC_01754]